MYCIERTVIQCSLSRPPRALWRHVGTHVWRNNELSGRLDRGGGHVVPDVRCAAWQPATAEAFAPEAARTEASRSMG